MPKPSRKGVVKNKSCPRSVQPFSKPVPATFYAAKKTDKDHDLLWMLGDVRHLLLQHCCGAVAKQQRAQLSN